MATQTLPTKVAIWSAGQLARGVWALAKQLARPAVGVPVLAVLGLMTWVGQSGPIPALLTLTAVTAGLIVWRWQHRSSFTRLVGVRVLALWGRLRYGLVWRFWMGRLGLTLDDERTGKSVRPRLVKVKASASTDSLLISLPAGFKPDDLREKLEDLANAAKATETRMRRDTPRRVWIDLVSRDPLTKTVEALPIPETSNIADLHGVAIGRCEDGTAWRLRLNGNHILIAGVSGAGKGSVIWSIIRACAPMIRDGYVRIIGLDPKLGVELAWGRSMMATYCDGDLAEMADALEAAVADMQARGRRMAGKARTHTPTPTAPLVLVFADELAALTVLAPREFRRDADRIDTALGLLLTQGRALGYVVIGAVQDPSKEMVHWRQLFPTKIALRVDTASQVEMTLGEGMRDLGAYADRISDTTPGIGYAKLAERKEPVKVRAAYVTDDDLTHMNHTYRAPGALRSVPTTDNTDTDGETPGDVAA